MPIYDGTLRQVHVPILMYHYISPLPGDADEFRVGLTVEPHIFRGHLQYLYDAGYTTISLYDLHAALMIGAPLPPQPIILTFDDGHLDHYTEAFPVLQEFGFTATFFIIADRVDMNDPAYMTWGQIREMAAAGMNMEGHTKTHRELTGRDLDFLVYEIIGSMESVAAHTEQPAHMFAYPAGRYDDFTLEIIRTMPVWVAVTTEYGAYHTSDALLELPRLRVTGNMGAAGLDHLLRTSR